MNFPYGLLPDSWHWAATPLFAVALLVSAWRAPWRGLKDNEQLHVYLGTCVGLMVLWTVNSRFFPGLDYHYLGAALLTLMFGWPLAFIAISLVLAAVVLNGGSDWQSYPMNALTMGALPVALSYGVYRIVETRLPNNFFIYIFLCAYLGAALSLMVAAAVASSLLVLGHAYTAVDIVERYLPLMPLMMVPEGFITGALITVMVALRPAWVSTFDDKLYIEGK